MPDSLGIGTLKSRSKTADLRFSGFYLPNENVFLNSVKSFKLGVLLTALRVRESFATELLRLQGFSSH